MKQTITLNNRQVEVEITQEMVDKFLEHEKENEDEIKEGEIYYSLDSYGNIMHSIHHADYEDIYRIEQDNALPRSKYTAEQAREYFDKRDAIRAAETRIKKAIERKNGDLKRNCEMGYDRSDSKIFITDATNCFCSPESLRFNKSIGTWLIENHEQDYKIYFGVE